MPLFVCGLNHKSADIAQREQFAIPREFLEQALVNALASEKIHEAVIVSTCNRCELYCVADSRDAAIAWLSTKYPGLLVDSFTYCYQDEIALSHLLQVTSGLDSMVLGEPEVFGQVKQAYLTAVETKAAGSKLEHLFQFAFQITKKIRTETLIGQQSVSVASGAVNLAKCIFANLESLTVLLVGAGETIELVATHLREQGVTSMIVANRTLAKAQALANKFNSLAIGLDQLMDYLPEVDMVLSATDSHSFIFNKEQVELANKSARRRPLFFIDIALPRDIDPKIGDLDGVYLYNLDDLQQIADEGLAKRRIAALDAQKMIDNAVEHFMRQLQEREAVGTICAYRNKIEQLRDQELAKALEALTQGEDPQHVLTQLARGLTNKFLHIPSVELRRASSFGQKEFIGMAKRLFGVEEKS
jgi:glutamyl-tRNA reductase